MSIEVPQWLERFRSATPQSEKLPQAMQDLSFAMGANGYILRSDGTLQATDFRTLQKDTNYLETVFRTPDFLSLSDSGDIVANALHQTPVLDVVRRYRGIDEGEAGRISFLLGGIARSLNYRGVKTEDIASAVAFSADMIKLGERRSGEAIAAAMAMYLLSGGSYEEDRYFKQNVYYMAEAITGDPITPWETADLGRSQAARLLGFVRKRQNAQDVKKIIVPATAQYREVFATLPTIGAEFHITGTKEINATFWKRVAMLNMAQYQSGSHIPFSRNEEGLIEIRMNPSIYPVATVTWKLMRLLLPELNRSYFTMTVNRRVADFSMGWDDNNVITLLHALGNLHYATFFNNVPQVATPEQVNFGDRYLGQTVRVTNGRFSLTGNWGGKGGQEGQLNICTGFGDLFPGLAFYLSMGLVEPAILEEKRVLGYDIRKAALLSEAIKFKERDIWNIFKTLDTSIENNPRLNNAIQLGERIIKEFSP